MVEILRIIEKVEIYPRLSMKIMNTKKSLKFLIFIWLMLFYLLSFLINGELFLLTITHLNYSSYINVLYLLACQQRCLFLRTNMCNLYDCVYVFVFNLNLCNPLVLGNLASCVSDLGLLQEIAHFKCSDLCHSRRYEVNN